eukprot:4662504-Pyramimonas_sp.AAC.1
MLPYALPRPFAFISASGAEQSSITALMETLAAMHTPARRRSRHTHTHTHAARARLSEADGLHNLPLRSAKLCSTWGACQC